MVMVMVMCKMLGRCQWWGVVILQLGCAHAAVVPQSCLPTRCEPKSANAMTWDQAADALQLTYTRAVCVPDIESVPQTDEDVNWALQANQWRIRNRVGQASLMQGDLSFVSHQQILKSETAWMWRSADGGLDKLCLPRRALWTHASWHMVMDHLIYQADSDEISACDNAFVLYGRAGQPLYGYASQATLLEKNTLALRDVHATTCPLSQRVWSLSAEQLDWDQAKKRAIVKNARFYFYDFPVMWLSSMQFSVGGQQTYGWQSPRFASYHDDLLVAIWPYRLQAPGEQMVAPWVGSGLSAGWQYTAERDIGSLHYRMMLRSGLYYQEPRFRYGGIVQGAYRHLWGPDLTQFQWLHMRDGWFGQYFAPGFIKRIRPNQDLPSYIAYQREDQHLQTKLSAVYYQKFSGEKVLQDEIAIPYLHVLPRLKLVYKHDRFDAAGLAEHLVANTDKDAYPGVTRGLGYLGYAPILKPQLQLRVGAWLKDQLVDDCQLLTQCQSQHAFVAPNIAFNMRKPISMRYGLDLAYAYTYYVDQSLDPVFQRQWQWLGDQVDFDKLSSVDRVYDRNRMWLGISGVGVPYAPTAQVGIQHVLDFTTPKVSLSSSGAEDPLLRYPNAVSLLRFNDPTYHFSSQGVWVWPARMMQYYDLQWQYQRIKLKWTRRPDFVVYQNQTISVPISRVTGGEMDFYQSAVSRGYLGVDYQSGLDRFMHYQLGWTMDSCCWQGKMALHVMRWMSKDTSVSSVYRGWQPSASVSFNIKGLSNIKRRG